jgi:hypothetical protein
VNNAFVKDGHALFENLKPTSTRKCFSLVRALTDSVALLLACMVSHAGMRLMSLVMLG